MAGSTWGRPFSVGLVGRDVLEDEATLDGELGAGAQVHHLLGGEVQGARVETTVGALHAKLFDERLQLLVDQVDERRRTVPPPSDHLRSPVGLATSPDLQGRVARRRIQAMRHEKETPDAQGAGHPDNITGHGGHLSRITTTWLPEYTSFRPVPPQLPNRRAMTAESHVRSFSPLQRRQSPSENTLSPLQRRVHSPDSFANARPRPPEHPPQVSADVSYEEMIRPQTHHADQTHAARSPASGAQMSQQRPGGRGRQAWGTPMGSPIGASPRTKFIHDRGANGTPASSIAGLLLFPPASIR